MNPYAIGSILGAIVITFLLSRLALWLGRRWITGTAGVIVAYGIVLAFIFVAAGFGYAAGGGFRAEAAIVYLVPLIGWLVFDLVRRGMRPTPPGQA